MDQEKVLQTTEKLFRDLGFTPHLSLEEKGETLSVVVEAGADNPLLIGFHGETLVSLQTVLNLILFRQTGEFSRTVLDVGNYRQEREEKIKQIAVSAADRARFLARPVELSPMRPDERRLVHLYVSQLPGVMSESLGEGRERRVVVKPSAAPGGTKPNPPNE